MVPCCWHPEPSPDSGLEGSGRSTEFPAGRDHPEVSQATGWPHSFTLRHGASGSTWTSVGLWEWEHLCDNCLLPGSERRCKHLGGCMKPDGEAKNMPWLMGSAFQNMALLARPMQPVLSSGNDQPSESEAVLTRRTMALLWVISGEASSPAILWLQRGERHLLGFWHFQFPFKNTLSSGHSTLFFLKPYLYMILRQEPRSVAGLARGWHLQNLGTGDVPEPQYFRWGKLVSDRKGKPQAIRHSRGPQNTWREAYPKGFHLREREGCGR